jgi:ankyrin repeat protein
MRNLDGALKALQAGANPSAAVYGNWTCLSEAVAGSDSELVRRLLQHGATVASTVDEEGSTSLHEAAEDGSHAIVQLLVEAGGGRDWLTPVRDGRAGRDQHIRLTKLVHNLFR